MGKNKNGDDWNAWFQEWGSRFLLFARQQCDSLVEAEDILQEAFVYIWSRIDQFAEIRPGLIFLQIRRVAIDRARRNMRRHKREEAYAQDVEPAFFRESPEFTTDELQRALQQLTHEQREVLTLKVWGDQTFESIAETLEISPNTAASRYRYGLEKLRNLLGGAVQ